MVIDGEMMWDAIVNPNWIRARYSAVRPSIIPLFPHPRQLHPRSALPRRPAVSFIRVGAGDLLLQPNPVVLLGPIRWDAACTAPGNTGRTPAPGATPRKSRRG